MHDGEVTRFDEVARYQSDDLLVRHEPEDWQSRIADATTWIPGSCG